MRKIKQHLRLKVAIWKLFTVLQLGFDGRGVPSRALFAQSYKNEGTMCHVMC